MSLDLLGQGDPNGGRTITPASALVAAADSGGGYAADAHNSVASLGQFNPNDVGDQLIYEMFD